MNRHILIIFLAVLFVSLVGMVSSSTAATENISRITKEEVKGLLGSDDVVIIDVRSGRDWGASELKIQGAVRENPEDFGSWYSKYPKEKTLVLYCA